MPANMGNVLGLIFANMHDNTISDLTKQRTMGSVLFGGRYRLIDFPLSSMVNSGISEVGVITKANYQSLLDHLGSAREWDLSRKKGGLHILPPFGHIGTGLYRGRLEAMYGAMGFIENSSAEYVVLSDCDIIANINFKPIVERHIESSADITAVCYDDVFTLEQTKSSTVFSVDESGRIFDVVINPQISGSCTISMNIFVIKKSVLVEILNDTISRSQYSFERDILQARIKELKIVAYKYSDYLSRIDSISSYFKANMDLISPTNNRKLYLRSKPIYTKVRDNAPCKYGIDAVARNSIVADGCIIEGEVENSVLFRGVKIGKGAKVKNAILMQDTVVGEKSELNYVITDKNVKISGYRNLQSSENYPMYIAKGGRV